MVSIYIDPSYLVPALSQAINLHDIYPLYTVLLVLCNLTTYEVIKADKVSYFQGDISLLDLPFSQVYIYVYIICIVYINLVYIYIYNIYI